MPLNSKVAEKENFIENEEKIIIIPRQMKNVGYFMCDVKMHTISGTKNVAFKIHYYIHWDIGV